MIAYLTTVGEKTTDICKAQLETFGFEVVVLDEKESWPDKYKRFLDKAGEEDRVCMRIDADVILNEKIKEVRDSGPHNFLMAQCKLWDFYQNDVLTGQPVFYTPSAIRIIKREFQNVNVLRPETWAWRIPEINEFTKNFDQVVGMHGYFQDMETVERAEQNKINRGQIDKYDFGLVKRLMKL